ncbi:hypothetical protein PRIPAC_97889 [Pristionchus pacificus]|uniref:Phosphotransferase n=1 Tax=Pristionchus pacificus TaxID=54126 RepID=A0A454Y6G6_PRIPA|nr:hypothetical protein PRIPAC_97889 [Pristionchus pacificus]|eukprot:PDM63508.1 phosphotransferase [Pristionchus pacificus]
MTKLLGSSYTTEYVIRQCFPEIDNVNERVRCEILHLENAKSFWSLIARISLKWTRDEDREQYPSSIFIKVPTISANVTGIDEDIDGLKQTLIDLTANEETFYRLMDNAIVRGFPYPHYYHGEEVAEVPGREGCLVLEDFSGQVASLDYIPGFTLPQVECLIDALASWHAYVFDHPELTKPFHHFKHIDADFQNLLFTESQKLESFAPDWFDGRIRPLEEYFTTEYAYGAIRSYGELDIPPVIVHMDMNTTNVLWNKETMNTNKPEISSIIDFQQVHTGNICEDIARILQIGVSVELRRENEDRLLDRYHQKLEKIMGKRNPVSLDQVHSAYRRVFPFVSNFSLFAVVCYHSMYNEQEKDERIRAEKQQELLSRAKGVVDDVYRIINL